MPPKPPTLNEIEQAVSTNPNQIAELDKAVQEFEQSSANLYQPTSASINEKEELPTMVKWVMKLSGGAIKEQRQAEYVLLTLAGFMVLLTFVVLFSGGGSQYDSRAIQKMLELHPEIIPTQP